MLVLRLQRLGKKKNPSYRVIVSEKTKDTQAGTLENLGTYNPVVTPKVLKLNKERILHWISVGAQPSASVHNLLVRDGIIEGSKEKSVFLTQRRKEKLEKKNAQKAEADVAKKEKAAAEAKAKAEADAKAKADAEAAAKAEAETPVEEAPVEEKAPEAETPVEEAPAEEVKE